MITYCIKILFQFCIFCSKRHHVSKVTTNITTKQFCKNTDLLKVVMLGPSLGLTLNSLSTTYRHHHPPIKAFQGMQRV